MPNLVIAVGHFKDFRSPYLCLISTCYGRQISDSLCPARAPWAHLRWSNLLVRLAYLYFGIYLLVLWRQKCSYQMHNSEVSHHLLMLPNRPCNSSASPAQRGPLLFAPQRLDLCEHIPPVFSWLCSQLLVFARPPLSYWVSLVSPLHFQTFDFISQSMLVSCLN